MKALAAKMIQVMKKVSYIEKTGWNDFKKFKYISDADCCKAFNPALSECGIAIFTSQQDYTRESVTIMVKGKPTPAFFTTVRLKVTFVDIESGESYAGLYYGDGIEKGDKGLYIAITGALKYALMKTFVVETGDDPETDSPEVDCTSFGSLEDKLNLEKAAHRGTIALRDAFMEMSKNSRDTIQSDEEFITRMKIQAAKADDVPK